MLFRSWGHRCRLAHQLAVQHVDVPARGVFAHTGFDVQSVFGTADGGGCVLCDESEGGDGVEDA